jgi:hypothetical protein
MNQFWNSSVLICDDPWLKSSVSFASWTGPLCGTVFGFQSPSDALVHFDFPLFAP